ncbi:hypothetical protein [Synechococcus sp. C9]|uniref:hypothetical protein n=1 Tax=Synechococcus sp. C9 TaxID=102119 RepID=UPI001FF5E5EF|nr:hypothetical protein [Synechococcus sp. C9]
MHILDFIVTDLPRWVNPASPEDVAIKQQKFPRTKYGSGAPATYRYPILYLRVAKIPVIDQVQP